MRFGMFGNRAVRRCETGFTKLPSVQMPVHLVLGCVVETVGGNLGGASPDDFFLAVLSLGKLLIRRRCPDTLSGLETAWCDAVTAVRNTKCFRLNV